MCWRCQWKVNLASKGHHIAIFIEYSNLEMFPMVIAVVWTIKPELILKKIKIILLKAKLNFWPFPTCGLVAYGYHTNLKDTIYKNRVTAREDPVGHLFDHSSFMVWKHKGLYQISSFPMKELYKCLSSYDATICVHIVHDDQGASWKALLA